MKRITPEEVLDAYAKTGLKPARNFSRPSGGKCCAIGALATSYGEGYPMGWANRKYGSLYVDSFIRGFDGKELFDGGCEEAYSDGLAAAHAVFQGSK